MRPTAGRLHMKGTNVACETNRLVHNDAAVSSTSVFRGTLNQQKENLTEIVHACRPTTARQGLRPQVSTLKFQDEQIINPDLTVPTKRVPRAAPKGVRPPVSHLEMKGDVVSSKVEEEVPLFEPSVRDFVVRADKRGVRPAVSNLHMMDNQVASVEPHRVRTASSRPRPQGRRPNNATLAVVDQQVRLAVPTQLPSTLSTTTTIVPEDISSPTDSQASNDSWNISLAKSGASNDGGKFPGAIGARRLSARSSLRGSVCSIRGSINGALLPLAMNVLAPPDMDATSNASFMASFSALSLNSSRGSVASQIGRSSVVSVVESVA